MQICSQSSWLADYGHIRHYVEDRVKVRLWSGVSPALKARTRPTIIECLVSLRGRLFGIFRLVADSCCAFRRKAREQHHNECDNRECLRTLCQQSYQASVRHVKDNSRR